MDACKPAIQNSQLSLRSILLVVTGSLLSGCVTGNYNASEFFSVRAFEKIKPAMSEDAVRALIGPPLSRSVRASEPDRVRWHYTSQKNAQSSWTECTIRFDRKSRKVVSTDRSRCLPFKDKKTGEYVRMGPRRPAPHWRIDQFCLPMLQGDPPTISGDPDHVYLIQTMASW